MEIKVTHSANAGVAMEIGSHRIWIDALHEEKQPGFSAANPDILEHEAFAAPGYICYTHCHGDHFSENLTAMAKRRWPQARLYLPEPVFAQQYLISGDGCTFQNDDLKLRFFPLPHEGMQYTHVKHYGLLVSVGGCNILAAGDCATGSPALLEALNGEHIHVAILDFPWITLAKGRAALKKLRPEHILVCHLPFAQDDMNGYRDSAVRSSGLVEQDVRLLLEPLQEETIHI